MAENSLFAMLLRSSCWISFAIAAFLFLLGRFVMPTGFAIYSISLMFPFIFIGIVAAWRQRHKPSAAKVADVIERVGAMPWREFSALMVKAFEQDGFEVTIMDGAADLKLLKSGVLSLVCCKRWKAANHGVEVLRDLEAAREAMDARTAKYVCLNDLSEQAQRFAQVNQIEVIQGAELARLWRLIDKKA